MRLQRLAPAALLRAQALDEPACERKVRLPVALQRLGLRSTHGRERGTDRVNLLPPPPLPYKVDTSRPSLRTN